MVCENVIEILNYTQLIYLKICTNICLMQQPHPMGIDEFWVRLRVKLFLVTENLGVDRQRMAQLL